MLPHKSTSCFFFSTLRNRDTQSIIQNMFTPKIYKNFYVISVSYICYTLFMHYIPNPPYILFIISSYPIRHVREHLNNINVPITVN